MGLLKKPERAPAPVTKKLGRERLPLVKGPRDPTHPECILVPATRAPKHPWFPRLNPKYNFMKTTHYRYDTKQKRVTCLVTVMPDGLHVAWAVCAYCSSYFTNCSCKAGIQTARSVEYIYDSIDAFVKKEPWGMYHKNYRGSLTRKEREERAASPQTFVMPERVSLTPRGVERPAQGTTGPGRKLLKKAPVVVQPPRKLLKRSTQDSVAQAVEDVDASGMLGAAEEMIATMTKRLTKEPATKKLLKKSEPVTKKLLRRSQ